MFGLSTYRLRGRRPAAEVFDFLDPESEDRLGVICSGAVDTPKRGPGRTVLDFLLRYRLPRYGLMACALVVTPFWIAGAILGLWPFQPRGPRYRLVVRRPDDRGIVFTLRVSSGLMYDSRRVYDGQGRLIAHFRSRFKTTLRGGFEITDLTGCEDDAGDMSGRPSLGRVVPSGGAYRLSLVGDPEAGRITPHTSTPADDPPGTVVRDAVDHYEIVASPRLRHDATGEVLLLAAALTLAWSPPG